MRSSYLDDYMSVAVDWLGTRVRPTSSGARRQARLKKYRTSDLLCFHLVVLLLERVDFAADHLDLLDMAGDCRRNVSTCLFASPSDATSGTMAGLERRKRLPAAQ
jgi:hypothetical protein